ncbi:MAG TPA: hypothetical protein VJA17_05010 [Candidatus Omnitrophota bacterium]|nr:hypothetical protein [Candidatus Omnitrophota bacterium]
MTRESARKFRAKERRLLKLYSLWQETRREEVQRQCLGLLMQIMALKPHFSLRHEFDKAF